MTALARLVGMVVACAAALALVALATGAVVVRVVA